MSIKIYNQLSSDLLKLYCSIKHPAIEDSLIKISQASGDDFCQWIKLNEKNIRLKIKEQKVFDVLMILCDARSRISYGQKINRGDMVKYLLSSSGKSSLIMPIIFAFDSIIKEFKTNILMPFSDLIDFMSNQIFQKQKDTDEEKIGGGFKDLIVKDLVVIQRLMTEPEETKVYLKHPSIKQQKIDMFLGLLNRFSNEIAIAFDARGMTELAEKIRGNILVKQPQYGLSSLFTLNQLSRGQINAAQLMSSYVLSHSSEQNINYNHDYIETTFLNQVGAISIDELYKIREEYERKKTPLGKIDDITDHLGMNIENKIPIDAHMNPDYLHLLSIFFYFMQVQMKII